MLSEFYIIIILVQLIFVLIFAYYLHRYQTYITYQFILCLLMIVLYSYEFNREIQIYQGNIFLINEIRLIILRIEHTIMGLFLGEVFHYVYQYIKPHIRKC